MKPELEARAEARRKARRNRSLANLAYRQIDGCSPMEYLIGQRAINAIEAATPFDFMESEYA